MILSWNGLLITGTYTPGEEASTQGYPDNYSSGSGPEFDIESAEVECAETATEIFTEGWPYLSKRIAQGLPISSKKLAMILSRDYPIQITEAAAEHWDELGRDT